MLGGMHRRPEWHTYSHPGPQPPIQPTSMARVNTPNTRASPASCVQVSQAI